MFVPGFGFQFGYLAANGRVLKDASRFLRFAPAVPRRDFLTPTTACQSPYDNIIDEL
jgi:hypothetical protein